MKVLIPPHNLKSSKVLELSDDLKSDILEMKSMMEKQNFLENRTGLALAHCQVSKTPYQILVGYDGRVFINAEILEKENPFIAKEMCLSFPFRQKVEVRRYRNITVKYQDESMKPHVKHLEIREGVVDGLLGQVFQHEIQHFNGENIYGKR